MNSSIISDYIGKDWRSRDLFYVITSKLNILVSHSGQILVGAISTIIKILNMTATACHLRGPFSVVFPKSEQLIIVTWPGAITWPILSFYWSYNIKVVEIGQAASSAKILPNPGRVITDFLTLCKLGLSHALTCLRGALKI